MAGCEAHRFHSPRPQALREHHVLPTRLGGSDEPGNLVTICPTGDDNVHRLFAEYESAGATPAWTVRRQYGPGERIIAKRGWDALREASA